MFGECLKKLTEFRRPFLAGRLNFDLNCSLSDNRPRAYLQWKWPLEEGSLHLTAHRPLLRCCCITGNGSISTLRSKDFRLDSDSGWAAIFAQRKASFAGHSTSSVQRVCTNPTKIETTGVSSSLRLRDCRSIL